MVTTGRELCLDRRVDLRFYSHKFLCILKNTGSFDSAVFPGKSWFDILWYVFMVEKSHISQLEQVRYQHQVRFFKKIITVHNYPYTHCKQFRRPCD